MNKYRVTIHAHGAKHLVTVTAVSERDAKVKVRAMFTGQTRVVKVEKLG